MGKRTKPLCLELHSEYHQIQLLDPKAKGDLGEAWTVKATEDRVAAAGDIVGIGTERVEQVSVEVEVLEREPAGRHGWDHATECSIEVVSGEVAVAGCTDYLPDAKRAQLRSGTWRVRACHASVAKAPEKIVVQLWPAERIQPRVLTRWVPRAAARKKTAARKRPTNAKQAAKAAFRGQPDVALEFFMELAAEGDAAAAASAAELLAFRGKWQELVPLATMLVANPTAVRAGNVFTDMCRLLRRAARELGSTALVEAAAARVPPSMSSRRDAVLLRDFVEPSAQPGPANLEAFASAVKDAAGGPRFEGRPKDLEAHCFALAVTFKVEDEIIARWDPANERLQFDQAVHAARVLARRGEGGRAWNTLQQRLAAWWPVDGAQVAPVILVVDPWLAPLMSPERCEQVLTTSRGPEAADGAA